MIDLPAELWTAIFDIAADEDIIFDYSLPNVMAESTWFNTMGQWQLNTPEKSLHLVQKRSYATKKARQLLLFSSVYLIIALGYHIHVQNVETPWLWIPCQMSVLRRSEEVAEPVLPSWVQPQLELVD
jgi:hypothetical protein